MQSNFSSSLAFVLRHECVYAAGHDNDSNFVVCEDVPGDTGGLTKYGIDAADHPGVDIRGLTLEEATAIYRDGEWTHCLCDQLPEGVDTAVFDCAVNNGVPVAGILLQRALLARGFGVVVDGEVGPATVWAATAACVNLKHALIGQLLQLRRNRYADIVLHHPGDARFLKGWLARVDDLEKFLF
jgi:lysozyme family protein